MKKIFLSALCFAYVLTGCQNDSKKEKISATKIEKTAIDNTKSNSDKDKTKNSTKKDLNYVYKSDNGENIDVYFFEKNDEKFVKIKRKDQDELILAQTNASAQAATYEKGDYTWERKDDKATFSDGKETMKLVLISPLQYKFTNGKEDITVRYFSENDKRFVSLKEDDKPEITLEQTTAWSKGAEYGKDDIEWHAQSENNGTLIKNDKQTKYKLKES
ncbi:MAG: MliC family protein [Flavobacteriaceae bacterium]|nr:MliC family protein [Psychroflexus sp.]